MKYPTLQERGRGKAERSVKMSESHRLRGRGKAERSVKMSESHRLRGRGKAWRRELCSLREEKRLRKKGYKKVACLDEAGRGCLAGPVVAAAALIKPCLKWNLKHLPVRDSKKLSPKKREELYKILRKHPAIEWGVARISEKVIDKVNILEATKLAMKKAVEKLSKKPNFLILDGNFRINSSVPQKSIIKADEKVFSCAIASILAKVSRDRIMERYHQKYPQYGFDKHKGYPTKLHRKMLKKYGPCKIHRRTFKPVKACPPKISKKLRRACKSKKFLLR